MSQRIIFQLWRLGYLAAWILRLWRRLRLMRLARIDSLVMLPSGYTADISKIDADDMAQRLGIQIDTVPIGPGMEAVSDMMGALFAGKDSDVTEENIQSRLRGLLLMALSNLGI